MGYTIINKKTDTAIAISNYTIRMESLTAPKTIDHQANFHSATFFEIKVFNNLDRPVIWKMFTNNTEKRYSVKFSEKYQKIYEKNWKNA